MAGLQNFLTVAKEYASAVRDYDKAKLAASKSLTTETAEGFDVCEAFAEEAKDVLEAAYNSLSDEAAAIVRAQFGEACSVAEWAEKVF